MLNIYPVLVLLEVLSLHPHFQSSLFWADFGPENKNKTSKQLRLYKLSEFSFALRLKFIKM